MRIIFLDFDGVLHPTGGPPGTSLPFEWVEQLADALDGFLDVALVVHSTWRLQFSFEELRDFLEPVQGRLLGVAGAGARATAITEFLSTRTDVRDCVILDDCPHEFPPDFPVPVIACDPERGINDPHVLAELGLWLRRGRSSTPG